MWPPTVVGTDEVMIVAGRVTGKTNHKGISSYSSLVSYSCSKCSIRKPTHTASKCKRGAPQGKKIRNWHMVFAGLLQAPLAYLLNEGLYTCTSR